MQRSDRLLIAIVIGAMVVVGLAIAIILLRPEATYITDDTPEGAAHNYLLALQNEDFEKAYLYLSAQLDGYPPTLERFIDDIEDRPYQFRLEDAVTLKVDSSDVKGLEATVTVIRTRFYGGDLFSSGQSIDTFEIEMHGKQGKWRIIDAETYFAPCWHFDEGCGY